MRILIVDDEKNIRTTTAAVLTEMGHETLGVENGAAALKQLHEQEFEVVFLDLRLEDQSGLELLPKLLHRDPRLEIVVFTAYASIESAVKAMQCGAIDYVTKPFTPDQIRLVLGKIAKTRKLQDRVADLESRISSDAPPLNLTTAEPALQGVYDTALKAAASAATILLLGESGTGKTVLARFIHERSAQKAQPFVTVSCPSLSRELLESELFGHVKGSFTGAVGDTWGKVAIADGGTLFLDEIGEMPLEIQPKLLRLLQEKEYERLGENKVRRANVRVLTATNRDLEQSVAEGRFREDLFYRLNVIAVSLPPLRERMADLMAIASAYLQFFTSQSGKPLRGFAPAAEQAMRRYGWPGNLRELRNVVERAVILAGGESIETCDLPDKLCQRDGAEATPGIQVGAEVSLEELEVEHIRRVLTRSTSMEDAAKTLGIDPATLYRKRKKLGL